MDAYSQAETLQKLERLTQLETMVAEQRIRIEKYKTMYETLKTEHVEVEEARNRRENELNAIKEEMQVMQNRFQELLNQARAENDMKIQECEELRLHVLSPQRIEVLRVKLQEEVEASYKQKLETADLELDKYRSDFNKLRYEYSFLKSEYEHEQNKTNTIVEELKSQYKIEIDILDKDKADLIEQIRSQEDQSDGQKIRVLQKDNAQLNMKVKSLLDELDEIREKREASGLQSDHVSRLQARQLSELSAHSKSLETERNALKMQLERFQNEVERATKQQESSTSNLIVVERENQKMKNDMEVLIHNHKLELNNLKLSLTKDRGELERQRDLLRSEVQASRNKISVLEKNIQDLKDAMSRKEEQLVHRVQEVKEMEWEKISKLESYKIQAESQLAESERRYNEFESLQKLQLEKVKEQLKTMSDEKEKAEAELNLVRMQQTLHQQTNQQLDESKRQFQELKNKHQKLQHNHDGLVTNGDELKTANEKLKDKLDLMARELKLTNEDMQKQQDGFQRSMQEARKRIEGSKKETEKEKKELKKELQDSKKNSEKIANVAKKKIKKQKKLIQDLLHKVEAEKAQCERIEAEKKSALQNLKLENERSKRALERFRKRQSQFTQLLHASSATLQEPNVGNISPNPLLTLSFEPQRETSSSKMQRDLNDFSPATNLDDLLNETSP